MISPRKILRNFGARITATFVLLAITAGCMSGIKPQQGGRTSIKSATTQATNEVVVSQGENASTPTKVDHDSEHSESVLLPAGTVIRETKPITLPGGATTNVITETVLTKATTVERVNREKTTTTMGAAQKDVARETSAFLVGMSPLYYIGAIIVVLGLALAFVPYCKVLMGGSTPGLMIAAGGIALVAMVPLMADKTVRMAIILGLLGVVGLYVFAHRHGRLQGMRDADRNGIDDRVEELVGKMKLVTTEAEMSLLIDQAKALPGGPAALSAAAELRRKELLSR